MVIVRLQKIEKTKICIEFWLYKAQMVQNQKVNISLLNLLILQVPSYGDLTSVW